MEDDFKHLVRISRKDVNGNKTIEQALTEIKGVGISLSLKNSTFHHGC